jgi:hypothetical protein
MTLASAMNQLQMTKFFQNIPFIFDENYEAKDEKIETETVDLTMRPPACNVTALQNARDTTVAVRSRALSEFSHLLPVQTEQPMPRTICV